MKLKTTLNLEKELTFYASYHSQVLIVFISVDIDVLVFKISFLGKFAYF